MTNLIDDLNEMKEDIELAKTNIAKHEGKKSVLIDKLKKEFNCEDIEEAEDKLEKLTKKSDKSEEKLLTGIKKLTEEYGLE